MAIPAIRSCDVADLAQAARTLSTLFLSLSEALQYVATAHEEGRTAPAEDRAKSGTRAGTGTSRVIVQPLAAGIASGADSQESAPAAEESSPSAAAPAAAPEKARAPRSAAKKAENDASSSAQSDESSDGAEKEAEQAESNDETQKAERAPARAQAPAPASEPMSFAELAEGVRQAVEKIPNWDRSALQRKALAAIGETSFKDIKPENRATALASVINYVEAYGMGNHGI